MFPRVGHDVVVDVQRDHPTFAAHDVGHQRRVVAGTGADLEDPVPELKSELLEHDRHDRRL